MNINRREFLKVLPIAGIAITSACSNEKPQQVEVGDLFHNGEEYTAKEVKVTGVAKAVSYDLRRIFTDDVDCSGQILYRLRNKKGRYVPIVIKNNTFYKRCEEVTSAPFDGQVITVTGYLRRLREFFIEGSPLGVAVNEVEVNQ